MTGHAAASAVCLEGIEIVPGQNLFYISAPRLSPWGLVDLNIKDIEVSVCTRDPLGSILFNQVAYNSWNA
jgi:hypothetical protein